MTKNGQDDYGRWMAVCYLEDGRNFNRMLIDSGYAAKKGLRNNEFDPESWYWEEQPIEETSSVQSDQEDRSPQAGSGIMPQKEAENKSWWQLILEIIAASSS